LNDLFAELSNFHSHADAVVTKTAVYLVGIFGIDVVLNSDYAVFGKVLRSNLHQV
jgi:hypothetical protein